MKRTSRLERTFKSRGFARKDLIETVAHLIGRRCRSCEETILTEENSYLCFVVPIYHNASERDFRKACRLNNISLVCNKCHRICARCELVQPNVNFGQVDEHHLQSYCTPCHNEYEKARKIRKKKDPKYRRHLLEVQRKYNSRPEVRARRLARDRKKQRQKKCSTGR